MSGYNQYAHSQIISFTANSLVPAMKFYLFCQGLTADEIDNLTRDFDPSQLGVVVAEGVILSHAFKERFSYDLYESIEKLIKLVAPGMIYIVGVSDQQFEIVSSLFKSGVSVILGTPLTLTVEQVTILSSLVDQSNTRLSIEYCEPLRGTKSRLFEWADHLDSPTNRQIHISINLNDQHSRFRSYVGPNKIHRCYELPCGVFHQELENCLNLIQPLVGKVINISIRESSYGFLPQNISDELFVEIEGSRSNAIIEVKISGKDFSREIWLSSDVDEIRIRQNENEGNILVSGAGKKNVLGRMPDLTRNLSCFLKPLFKKFGHSASSGELAFIRDYHLNSATNSIDIDRYTFINNALVEIAQQLSNINLCFRNCINTGKPAKNCKRVLITGASGMFGKRLSKHLNDKGYVVRAFIRKLSDCSYFQALGIEYCYGDVTDTVSLKQALEGVDYVVHAAADTSGDLDVGKVSTVQGTRNILEFCNQLEIEKLVYISSCNVYDVSRLKQNAEIDENSLLEQFPERRGGYTFTKLKADLLVQDAISGNQGNITCLRPGTYISENGPFMTPIVGVRLFKDLFVVFGLGKLILPLVFIENLCSATELSLTSAKAKGKTFNVIDGLSMSKREYLEKVVRKVYSNARFIFFPYKLLYFLIFLQEILLNFLRRKPYLTRYRFESSQKEIRYKSNKIEEFLDWSPPISADEAIDRILGEQKGS